MASGGDRVNELIRDHWDHRAKTFDAEAGHGLFSDEQRRAWLDLLSRLTGRTPQRVLDVGCGTGFLALRLAELGHDVTGIDLSPQMIEEGRVKGEQEGRQIDFHVGDAGNLDDADETYDMVVARHVIWALPDPGGGVSEWLRVLRPGGRLVLIEGKWADNTALQRSFSRPASQVLERLMNAASALALRMGGHPRKLLNRSYLHLEVHLPFSGGPTAARLADFLEANAVQDVVVEPLMDPTLWGDDMQFSRYLVAGRR